MPEDTQEEICNTWDESKLMQIRKVLHVYDEGDIDTALIKYAEMVEMFSAAFPAWEVRTVADWSIAVALAPDWFGEGLSTRINNTMLVSALLITVTTALLLYPPQYALPDGLTDDDIAYSQSNLRGFFYICSLANLLFIISIIFGVAFVENAMSRAYTEADKMYLIAKNYHILVQLHTYTHTLLHPPHKHCGTLISPLISFVLQNISQTTSTIGAFLFVIVLIIPTFKVFNYVDASVAAAVTIFLLVILIVAYVLINTDASKCQATKLNHFLELVNAETGRLLPEYYPPMAPVTPNYFKLMYVFSSAYMLSFSLLSLLLFIPL